nr:MAG TPA: UPF0335 protein [Caudoviricetes sp.]
MNGMSNKQLNEYIEMIARLVEEKFEDSAEIVEVIRSCKVK